MINKVTLVGNLGGDPEIRTLENGTPVGRFSLATTESFKDKEGDWQNQTEWHNIVVWRDLAERAQSNLKKGSSVYVEGKIQYRKYTDKDGVEKSVTDIICNTFRSLDKRERPSDAIQDTTPSNAPTQQNKQASAPPNEASDDLPF